MAKDVTAEEPQPSDLAEVVNRYELATRTLGIVEESLNAVSKQVKSKKAELNNTITEIKIMSEEHAKKMAKFSAEVSQANDDVTNIVKPLQADIKKLTGFRNGLSKSISDATDEKRKALKSVETEHLATLQGIDKKIEQKAQALADINTELKKIGNFAGVALG